MVDAAGTDAQAVQPGDEDVPRNAFDQTLEGITAALLLALMLIALVQVISRYLVDFSTPWTEELGRFVFTWLVWISAVLVTRRARHIRFQLFEELLPHRVKLILRILLGILSLVLWAVVVVYGWQVVQSTASTTYIAIPWLSVKYSYLVTVVGGGAIFLLVAGEIAKTCRALALGAD